MVRILAPGRLLAKGAGDTTPAGPASALLLVDGASGLKFTDNTSFLKLASSS